MAEKAAKSGDADRSVVDLQSDERWQERLAEARERRAQALKEQGLDDGTRRKPRKPWEENATPVRQHVAKPAAKPKKEIDSLDRMDALKRVTGSDTEEKRKPTASKPIPGSNWYPEADESPDETAQIEDQPDSAAPPDEPLQSAIVEGDIVRSKPRPHSTVDNVFDEASFSRDVPEPAVSLLLQPSEPLPPPSNVTRPWLERNYEAEKILPPAPETALPTTSDDLASDKRKWRMPGWVSVAALFLLAISAGPLSVYSPWQTRATGPATPLFGLQPALGLTSPLVGFPRTTDAADWRPASDVAPAGPLRSSQTHPPTFARIAPFVTSPLFGAKNVGVNLPSPAMAFADIPTAAPPAPQIQLSMLERVLGGPTGLVALPQVLAGVKFGAIVPRPRPALFPLTQ